MHIDRGKIDTIEAKLDNCLFLSGKVNSFEETLTTFEHIIKFLEYKFIDQDTRNRRCNLLFSGIQESKGEHSAQVISNFIQNYLDMDWPIGIQRAYRLGRYERGRKRTILVSFASFGDVQDILSRNRLLTDTWYSINKDFPVEITNARKSLWLTYKSIRSQNPSSIERSSCQPALIEV
jgi:hypothetical protein